MVERLGSSLPEFAGLGILYSVHPTISRLQDFLFKNLGKRPVIGFALLVAAIIFAAVTGNWLTETFIPSVFGGLKQLAGLPVSYFGLALVGLLAVLMIAAFVDTSPTAAVLSDWLRRRQQSKPRPLDAAELALVQDLRTVWNRYGVAASDSLHSLFQDVVHETKEATYWGDLLDPKVQELGEAKLEMHGAVAPDSTLSIAEVRERFNRMYRAYLTACRWLARIEDHDHVKLDRYTERLHRWRDVHRIFRDKLEDLVQQPAHHRTLAIYSYPEFDSSFARFMGAAETERKEQA